MLIINHLTKSGRLITKLQKYPARISDGYNNAAIGIFRLFILHLINLLRIWCRNHHYHPGGVSVSSRVDVAGTDAGDPAVQPLYPDTSSSTRRRQVLFKHVLPAMGIGLLIGIGIFNYIQGDTLKRLLGVMIVVLSARELINMFAKRKNSAPLSRSKSTAYVLSAGIVHGIYATGGPLLVYALNRLNMSKSIFRSTLAAIWTALNIVLVFSYVLTEKVTAMTLQTSTIILPSLVFGLLIGDMLHHRINERLFRIFTFALLLISGLPIIFK